MRTMSNLDLRPLLRTIEEKVIMNGARFLHHLLGVPLFATSRHRRCSPSSFLAHSIFLYTFWNTNLTTFRCVRFQTMKPLQVCISYQKVIRCSECNLEVIGFSNFVFHVLSSCIRILPSGHHVSSAILLRLTSHVSTSCSFVFSISSEGVHSHVACILCLARRPGGGRGYRPPAWRGGAVPWGARQREASASCADACGRAPSSARSGSTCLCGRHAGSTDPT